MSNKYKDFLDRATAKRDILTESITTLSEKQARLWVDITDLEVSCNAMNTVGLLVQQQFQGVIEELVTQALQFVYGPTHSFKIDSKIARGQPEMYLVLVIDGEEYSPRDDEVSGGQADVMCFALRVILWAMQHDRTRPTLVFDEPFSALGHSNHTEAISEMVTYISEMMGLQFVIITHNTEIATAAMTHYEIVMSKGISTAKKVQQLLQTA